MNWVYLSLAIIFEVCGTTFMKLSDGFTKLKFAAIMLIFYILSLSVLSLALKKIEVSVAYAIWSGFGIALIAITGVLFFKEPVSITKVFFVGLIIIGAIGLNLSGAGH